MLDPWEIRAASNAASGWTGGRVVVVTGGARRGGIGRAVTEAFLRLGDAVVLSDIGASLPSHPDYPVASPDSLTEGAADLRSLGELLTAACDVTDEGQVIRQLCRSGDRTDSCHPVSPSRLAGQSGRHGHRCLPVRARGCPSHGDRSPRGTHHHDCVAGR